jgi:hypothetical protein
VLDDTVEEIFQREQKKCRKHKKKEDQFIKFKSQLIGSPEREEKKNQEKKLSKK